MSLLIIDGEQEVQEFLKAIVHPKMNFLSSCTHPYVAWIASGLNMLILKLGEGEMSNESLLWLGCSCHKTIEWFQKTWNIECELYGPLSCCFFVLHGC